MKARVKWLEGVYFEGEAEGHGIRIEGSAEAGGRDRAIRPMHSILIGLASCSAHDLVSILRKARQEPDSCEVDVEAKRADSVPAVFTEISLHFRLGGRNLQAKRVEQAVRLSVEKYCSVARMLRQGGVCIDYSYSIVGGSDTGDNAM